MTSPSQPSSPPPSALPASGALSSAQPAADEASAPPFPAPPIPAAAVAKKAPPPGRKFPCRKCGAKLNFDPASAALACPYCGYVEKIEPQSGAIEEHDFEAGLKSQADDETVLAGRGSEVKCGSCGAVVLLEDQVAADRCPYCGAALENEPVAAKAMIAPESLLPFRVSQREAVREFNRWVAGLWFAPSALKQLANLGRVSGVYVPFWTYDSMTYSHYSGSRGEDYAVPETYVTTNSQGQPETHTRMVTRTAWYPASGRVDHFFDDVLVCASTSLPGEMIDALEPWDLPSLEAFDPAFLAGFKTERYAIGLADGFRIAQRRMDPTIRQLCRQDIGGDHQQLDSVQTQHLGVTFKHLLLPVWLAAYKYQDRNLRILINARTGEVRGARPYSWAKISALAMTIAAAVAAIGYRIATHR